MHLRRMVALLFLATLKVVSRTTWKQTTTSKYSMQSQTPAQVFDLYPNGTSLVSE